jgi:hypothetical protein
MQPYLANKRDKTFMDHYLLGADLSGSPVAIQPLNTVERVLLARIETSSRRAPSSQDWLDTLPKIRSAILFY